MTTRRFPTRSPRTAPGVDPTAIAASEAIEQALPVLGLLGAQLNQVVDTTEAAAVGFLTQTQAVDGAATQVASQARLLAELTAEQTLEIAVVAEASRGTGEVIQQLADFVSRRDASITELVREVRALSDHLGAIQKISRATTTLALNAKIEASRAGTHGATFQVVADEVRQLSHQSDAAAADIGARIEHLARRLAAAMEEQDGPDVPGADDHRSFPVRLQAVADEQRGLIERVETFTGRVEHASRELMSSSAAVQGLTTSMMGGLQFQDVTRQVIEHVVTSLDGLGTHIGAVAQVVAGAGDLEAMADLDALLGRIRAGYVMKMQRMVDAEATAGAQVTDDEPLIELF